VRAAVLIIGCLIGGLVFGVLILPEGEVATLSTVAADGAEFETQVWVVEGDGLPQADAGVVFLRAGSPDSAWLARLRARPQVELARGEKLRAYVAVPEDDAALRERVNLAMAEKYGIADRLIALVFDRRRSTPIRLVPDPSRPDEIREAAGEHAAPH
jgi:hypothetical protein